MHTAIVIGGGPVGLIAAHALARAGIDFLLLESRPEIVINTGSDLVLSSSGMRVLNQLGLLDTLDTVSTPLAEMQRIDHKGNDIGLVNFLKYQKEFFGTAPCVLSRHDLTKVFYESLPESTRARLLPNKRVATIASNTADDGVIITCRDGSMFETRLVIAADGAHSIVRQQMRDLALQHNASLPAHAMPVPVNDEQPYLTTFRCLWVRFPSVPSIPVGTTSETHGPGATTQSFAGTDTAVTGVYERLDTPTRERLRWTQADQEACIAKWGHLPVAKGSSLTLGEAYAARTEAGLVSLEEGVVESWSFDGRVVLAGDAAHKFTPSTGAGCNEGIVDIVALVNELYTLLPSSVSAEAAARLPSKADVDAALQRYQRKRHAAVVAAGATSGQATNAASWADWPTSLVDRYVISVRLFQRYMASKLANLATAKTPVFNFIEGEDRKGGSVAWVKPMKPLSRTVAVV
ncbi:FAD dependent monooxygenase [Microdochium nivale]|nr:FAD dependent monooxygenase [Microdochium nivale]